MQELASLTSNSWKLRAARHLNTCLSKGFANAFFHSVLLFLFWQLVHIWKQNRLRIPCLIPEHWSKCHLASGYLKREETLMSFYLLPPRNQQEKWAEIGIFTQSCISVFTLTFTFTESKTNASWEQPVHPTRSTPVLRRATFTIRSF